MHGLFSRGADLNVSHFESRRTQVVEGHVDPFPVTVCKIAFHHTHEFLGRSVPVRRGKWVGKGHEITSSVHLVCSLDLRYHQNKVPGSLNKTELDLPLLLPSPVHQLGDSQHLGLMAQSVYGFRTRTNKQRTP